VRLTEDIPISAKLLPEDDRWNKGWFGRGGAREARDPDIDRAWLAVKGALPFVPDDDLERFNADAGWGMLEL
jgi:hypothetical protein